jgi:cytochrome c oxidase subunit II
MSALLIIVVLILAGVAIGQAVRIFEISNSLKGKDENEITDDDNNRQGWYMLIFMFGMFITFIWMSASYWEVMLPKSASVHGKEIDNLMAISMIVITAMFFVTQPLLFYFAFKYKGKKANKATFVSHNDKLELVWTFIPAVVLAGLILYGLSTWNSTMFRPADEEPMIVEIYAKQFGWNARYSGTDNQLGYANVRNIEGINVLGVDDTDGASLDDVVTTELHLPVGKPVLFRFRAQDVIHSAFMPHFRVQMNCVPGAVTQFAVTPDVTTAEMRKEKDVIAKSATINAIRETKGEELYEFDYVLLCNKICGSAHYNMQMKIVVESQEEFDNWMSSQKTFAETL